MGNIFETFGCTHFQDQSGFKDKIKKAENKCVSSAERATLTDNLVTADKVTQITIATEDIATGNFIMTAETAMLTDSLTTSEKEIQVFISIEEETSGTETRKQHFYSSEKEVKNSRITGLCVLSPKYLVVADSENFYVSLYDVDGKFVESTTLKPQRPFGVAKIGEDKVVVTIPTANFCQIFIVQNNTLVEHGKINAGGDCCGIAFNECGNELVLLSLGKMKVFSFKTNTATWKLSRANMMKTTGPGSFGSSGAGQMPDSLALSPNNDMVYISSKHHNKIKAKSYGDNMELIREKVSADMRKPEGITTDKNGNVYVCVFESNKVMKFSASLEEQDKSFVWTVPKPVSIAYCESNNKLYVGTSGSITIYSKDLK